MATVSLRRSVHMVQRNLVVYKHTWIVVFSGFFEPLFYLLGIGIGLGAMVRNIQGMPYAAFIAPGLLAVSCMNGAVSDGFFNTFFKLHEKKTYDGIVATPMAIGDIVFGEMLWAVLRGATYAAAFLVLLTAATLAGWLPLLRSPWALAAWPAAVLVCSVFAALALWLTSVARRVEDFDVVVGLLLMPMFLLSGTFFPIGSLPAGLRWVLQVLPLSPAVDMLRQLTTGTVGPRIFGDVLYLAVLGAFAIVAAIRRLERRLMA